jgi:hypothetical protein
MSGKIHMISTAETYGSPATISLSLQPVVLFICFFWVTWITGTAFPVIYIMMSVVPSSLASLKPTGCHNKSYQPK